MKLIEFLNTIIKDDGFLIIDADKNKHLILESSHPSPFSAYSGFFHQNHFIKTNDYLSKNGYKKIDW